MSAMNILRATIYSLPAGSLENENSQQKSAFSLC